ncbi:MAG: flagellar biosynthesis anti-sigma factor FlgM [Desulfobacterales bacterium]|nr:flagellar biosynthesis anti-sigma factor FlgM [Desulfobacterales bacterium]MCP4159972.1 flagellar biosynthesis anti-sigma factor FlgM [Deltaproteobacteria bacterium]
MKVDGTNQYKKQTYVKETAKTENDKVSSKKKDAAKDTVSLSNDLKDLQLVKKAVDKSPSIRKEKVDELKSQIKNGTYKIDADKIAGKMLNSADEAI